MRSARLRSKLGNRAIIAGKTLHFFRYVVVAIKILLEKTRRQNEKTQAIYDLIISTPADGDNGENPEATELGRILSHLLWRRSTQQNNARHTHSDED